MKSSYLFVVCQRFRVLFGGNMEWMENTEGKGYLRYIFFYSCLSILVIIVPIDKPKDWNTRKTLSNISTNQNISFLLIFWEIFLMERFSFYWKQEMNSCMVKSEELRDFYCYFGNVNQPVIIYFEPLFIILPLWAWVHSAGQRIVSPFRGFISKS